MTYLHHGPLTVLVVDDNPLLRQAYGAFLDAHGHRMLSASDGREALDLLRRGERPDMILLDLSMPIMSGWEFRAAQQADPELDRIPVIVLSSDEVGPAEAGRLGCCGVLRKPCPSATIAAAIERGRACKAARAQGRRLSPEPIRPGRPTRVRCKASSGPAP